MPTSWTSKEYCEWMRKVWRKGTGMNRKRVMRYTAPDNTPRPSGLQVREREVRSHNDHMTVSLTLLPNLHIGSSSSVSHLQKCRKQNWSGQARCLWSEWVTFLCCALEQFGWTATTASLISLLAWQYMLEYWSRLCVWLHTLVVSVTNS